jgi:hypothetical protein
MWTSWGEKRSCWSWRWRLRVEVEDLHRQRARARADEEGEGGGGGSAQAEEEGDCNTPSFATLFSCPEYKNQGEKLFLNSLLR